MAVFLKPVYDEEDLNRKKIPKITNVLQTLQNSMIRVIYGLKKQNLKVPEKPKLKCMGVTYNGAKLFNMLPPQMRETKDPNTF